MQQPSPPARIAPSVSISQLTFGDDSTISVAQRDVVVIVGPNNSGKSATLRAIRDKLLNKNHESPVVKSIEIQKTGSPEDFSEWLSSWTVRHTDSQPDNPLFQALGHAMHRMQAEGEWQRRDHSIGGLTRWFCHLLSADERLQICNPPANIALARDNPSHPFHFLLRDDALELQMSAKFRRAFGVDLVVHRNAGSQIPVHIGDRPSPAAGEDRVSISYIERLEKLPTLHTQGDGMRSFAGVLLATSVGRESIMLIDEPEAFLHPPQARFLGTTLVHNRSRNSQLFIATHSTDILRGVLDSDSPDIRVIRIQRKGTVNSVRLLSNQRIKELWSDPLLRYSNILDGLFHERVVVCEADSDCRFYSAILDATTNERSEHDRRQDVMFTHCGGKARLPVVVRALREVDVPVCAVADFDVLSEEQPLRSIVESLGVSWPEVQDDWRIVKRSIDSKKPDLSTSELKQEIDALLSSITQDTPPSKVRTEMQKILRRASPWANAKLAGKVFVPSGDPSQACERLLTKLRKIGLFVVEVGELEGFARTIGGHGPRWVDSVLTRDIAADTELESARKFVLSLIQPSNPE